MIITPEKLNRIYVRYCQFSGFPAKASAKKSFSEAIEFIEQRFKPEYINLAAVGSANKHTFNEHKNDWLVICEILNSSLSKDAPFTFNADKARAASILADQHIDYTNVMALHGENANLGIREKFVKGTLSHHEWLTDLDLLRMLQLTETQDKIHVLAFDEKTMGTMLHFEREKVHPGGSYIISLLLNKGAQDAHQGVHWFAATITIDEVAHNISYTITDSLPVSDAEKANYEALIKRAITYQERNKKGEMIFSAFPENTWTITGKVISQDQADGYSCGYRALHNLLQDNALIGENELAHRYRSVNAKGDALAQAFYQAQLENLAIQPAIFQAITPQQQKLFLPETNNLRRVSPTALDGILTANLIAPTDNIQSHPSVNDAIGKLDNTSTVLSFPGVEDLSLKASDYEDFFKDLQSKLTRLELQLTELSLRPCDLTALDGLNAYCLLNAGIRAASLTIEIHPKTNPDEFIQKLLSTLINLDANNLPKITFIDEEDCCKKAHWKIFAEFIANNALAIEIDLPKAYLTSTMQRTIDEKVSINQRAKNKQTLNDNTSKINPIVFERVVKRKRPILDTRAGLNIDVELQQEQQVEMQVATQMSNMKEEATGFGNIQGLTLYNLEKAIREGKLNHPAINLISAKALKKIWHTWMSDVVLIEKDGNRHDFLQSDVDGYPVIHHRNTFDSVSLAAARELLNHHSQFKDGLNIGHLPKGFVIVPAPDKPDSFILHYDSKVALQNNNTVTPVIKKASLPEPLAVDVCDGLLALLPANSFIREYWKTINDREYIRADAISFRRYLPELMLFSAEQQQLFQQLKHKTPSVFAYIVENYQQIDEVFDGKASTAANNEVYQRLIKAFNPQDVDILIRLSKSLVTTPEDTTSHLLFTLLNNQPELKQEAEAWAIKLGFNKKQINALLRVYSEYGETGLRRLFHEWSLLDADLLKELHAAIFKNAPSFSPMIKDLKTKDALQIVSGIKQDKAQYEWWSTLLKQHVESVGFDSFPELVEVFTTFSKTIKAYNLDFYPNVAFSNVRSMPTVLSRILTLLSQSQADEREAQWQCITAIPLQANGAIRALADLHSAGNRFGFVVPEMRTMPVYYDNAYGYSTSMEWKNIASEANLIETRERFYRYIANQKHRLPLAFYQEMDKAINKTVQFNDEQKASLYAILAESTTGETNSEMSANIEQSKKNWIDIIDKLDNLTLPLVFKPFANKLRNQLVERLYGLKNLPSLPILQKLSALMNQTLTVGVTKIKQKANELADSCDRLERFTEHLGNSIYVGMSFYTEDSYMNTQEPIFYRHLDAAYSIATGSMHADNLDHYKLLFALISTFGLANGTKEENDVQGKKIRELFDSALYSCKNELKTAMSLLSGIESIGNPPLSPNDLQQFLTDFVSNKYKFSNPKAIQDFVKQRFETNFPKDYFKRLQADTIPPDVQQWIDGKFESSEKTQVLAILNYFITPGDAQLYMAVTRNLAAITNTMSKDERFNFLHKLTTDVLLSGATIAAFNQLLVTIKNKELANDFLFFLNKAEHAPQPVLGALAKLQVYLKTILPNMKDVESKVVRRMDSLNLIIDLLLATAPDKLDSRPRVKRVDDEHFQTLFSELNTLPEVIDTQKLAHLITSFIQHVPLADSLIELKRLYTHLDELHAPEPIESSRVQVKTEEKKPEKKTVNEFFGKISSFFSGLSKKTKKEPIKEVAKPIIQEVVAVVKKPKLINAELVKLAKDELARVIEKRKQFEQVFVDLFLSINQAAEYYAGDKHVIINYLQHFLIKNNSLDEQIVFAWNNINLLKNEFIALNDADIVRSLCAQFNQDSGDFTPFTLVELLSSPDYKSFNGVHKKLFLNILTSLLNNSKPCSLLELNTLTAQCRGEHGPVILAALEKIYKSAPFPSLKMFETWRASCPEHNDLATYLDEQYKAFDRQPCERETSNGFNLAKARAQANLMSGVVYTDDELNNIEKEVNQVRALSTEEIKGELRALRAKTRVINNDRLVALVAELLYRTKGLPALLDTEGKPQLGRSFEIHTTQYLAIHSMLKSGQHVTAEIGTGEGKSRIMMLMIACQYAQGQTVDFVTADVELAYRDYSSFHSFFHALGAKTNLIYQTSPANDYAMDGINFSDAANLSLFRNRARSEGLADRVIAQELKNRALLLDEADKAYFDLADTRFNYSTLANETIRDMQWVYDVMVGFFAESDATIMDLYQNDIDACNNQLMAYAVKEVGPEMAKRLSGVSQAQLEAWQQSALTALALKLDSDFVIKSDIEIETAKGPKIVSEARLLIGNRENRGSKFSFGVHQCLHARLNRLKASPHKAREDESTLVARLADCKPDFFIDNEKQIVYSSTSKSMISEYEEGSLYAVTGTAGSIREREEAAILYGQGEENKMEFITMPRHQGLKRRDYPLYLAATETTQNALILKQIQMARAANQPTILICENDSESAKLMAYLQEALPNDESLVRLSAQNETRHEAEYIEKKAGLPGMVTLSTGMIGRGTDIPLHGKATDAGLKVLINYLPREREYYQIIGRAGRFGAKGDARLILNKQALKKQLGKNSLKDGFYTATEAYIRQQHAMMDREAQVERLIKFTVGDFRRSLTQNYFNDFFREIAEPHQNYNNKPWSTFFKETDTKWTEIWQALKSKLDSINPDVAVIEQYLGEYRDYVQSKWTDLIKEVSHQDLSSRETAEAHPATKLIKDVGALTLSLDTKALMNTFNVSSIAPLKTAVYEKYDPAHDGRAVLYTRSFEKIRAIFRGERALFADFKAWKAGRGILFPNLRAWWNGNMTLGQLLFGGATSESEIISLTPRTAQAKHSQEISSSPRKICERLGVTANESILPLDTESNYDPILKRPEDDSDPQADNFEESILTSP